MGLILAKVDLIISLAKVYESMHVLLSININWLSISYVNYHRVMCMNLTNKMPNVSFKGSDLLNPHVIICMVDNQPEIDGTRLNNAHRWYTVLMFTDSIQSRQGCELISLHVKLEYISIVYVK